MASLTQVAFVLILCLVIIQHDSDHFVDAKEAAGHVEMHNRKVLVLSEKQVVEVDGKNLEGWELRMVPSGPDPLHHNANPKKPRTP
ncbi:hypothetical protein Dsin_019656 [Dipteronia sinensis]|uniref:Uncharacterized protein n=1 Tax=Dipteronia sinensis TaxID=43782 RepID=A0AAE0A7Y4_9ROSI|nr:hypothetical protein Dsin_019656 [Dipteronia sinensis]